MDIYEKLTEKPDADPSLYCYLGSGFDRKWTQLPFSARPVISYNRTQPHVIFSLECIIRQKTLFNEHRIHLFKIEYRSGYEFTYTLLLYTIVQYSFNSHDSFIWLRKNKTKVNLWFIIGRSSTKWQKISLHWQQCITFEHIIKRLPTFIKIFSRIIESISHSMYI